MLVYYYLPKGYAALNGKQIHGNQLGFPPVEISWEEFFANKDILVEAPFSKDYIENRFGKPNFPYNGYITLSTVRCLPYKTLQKIASYFNVPALMDNTKLIYSVRGALKNL
jgi:hypothetical protein